MDRLKKSLRLTARARYIRTSFQNMLAKFAFPDYTFFIFFAVLIGTAAGLAAVFFHNSIEFFNNLFFEQTTEGLFFLGAAAVIILPAIGMLIQSIMISLAPDTSQKKGVSEVIKATALRGGYIPFRTTLFHFFAPVICIGSGGTVGPEGPAAQLGGGVASKIGNFVGLSDSRRRIFTAAGAGAAIAAIFNTPLGGVFFALEIVMLNDFHTPTFSALIVASVTASAISRIFLGSESVFLFQTPEIAGYSNLYLYAILGLLAGFISILFIRYSNIIDHTFRKKILAGRIPQWLIMIFVGLIVGVCGYFYKEIFGIGYYAINEILAGSIAWKVILILFTLKFILVPLVLHSGGFGGVFAPSLFMGACFGYLFTIGVNYFWGLNLDPTTFVLVSMGAMLGGINTIPITAIMIIFEMTQDYSFILPLMIAVIISTTIVQLVLRGSVHVKHLEEQGYQITEGRETNLLKSIFVEEVKLDEIELIPDQTPLPELIAKMIESPNNTFYTVDSVGKLTGTITETEIRPIITEYDNVKDVIVASDIINPQVVSVNNSDDLDSVLKLFGKWNHDQFPVIHQDDPSKFLGAIARKEVIAIYNRESLKINLADGLTKELRTIKETTHSEVAVGYSIFEQTVPIQYVGKSLADLKIRNKYGLEVLMIKQTKDFLVDGIKSAQEIISPEPDYKLKESDKLVLFGKNEKIEEFKKAVI
ncbi:MAG: chloride channel protein [Ignavibacteria bacterium]|nr:chloride channel protein [Ignavibacteria bacterium]